MCCNKPNRRAKAVWENQKTFPKISLIGFERGTETCQVERAGMKAKGTVFTKVWIH